VNLSDDRRQKTITAISEIVDKTVERIKKEGRLLKSFSSRLSGLPPFFKSETQEIAYYCARDLLSKINRNDLEDMWRLGKNLAMEETCNLSDSDLLDVVAKMCAKFCDEELNKA